MYHDLVRLVAVDLSRSIPRIMPALRSSVSIVFSVAALREHLDIAVDLYKRWSLSVYAPVGRSLC